MGLTGSPRDLFSSLKSSSTARGSFDLYPCGCFRCNIRTLTCSYLLIIYDSINTCNMRSFTDVKGGVGVGGRGIGEGSLKSGSPGNSSHPRDTVHRGRPRETQERMDSRGLIHQTFWHLHALSFGQPGFTFIWHTRPLLLFFLLPLIPYSQRFSRKTQAIQTCVSSIAILFVLLLFPECDWSAAEIHPAVTHRDWCVSFWDNNHADFTHFICKELWFCHRHVIYIVM